MRTSRYSAMQSIIALKSHDDMRRIVSPGRSIIRRRGSMPAMILGGNPSRPAPNIAGSITTGAASFFLTSNPGQRVSRLRGPCGRTVPRLSMEGSRSSSPRSKKRPEARAKSREPPAEAGGINQRVLASELLSDTQGDQTSQWVTVTVSEAGAYEWGILVEQVVNVES